MTPGGEPATLGVAVIGYGYWGPNLVRNFSEAGGARVRMVSDLRPERLALVKTRYPDVEVTTDHLRAMDDPAVQAVAIATPVSTHYELVLKAMERGKHVMVAKPLADTSERAWRLVEEAARRRVVLHVDHTFLYTGAVRRIRELVRAGELGAVHYYDAVRVNLGLFQHDVNVIWDLAVHDLSILDFVLPMRPRAVSAIGTSHVPGEPEDIAYVTLFYEDNFIAHAHVSWLAPVKVRRTLIGGSRRMVVYDDLAPDEKVKVYDSGIEVRPGSTDAYRMLIDYRVGDMWAPKVSRTEALHVEVEEFLRCVRAGTQPESGGEMGARLVTLLEAATRSMSRRGEIVELPAS
jgi:predicted dehydrogenase